MARYLLDTNVVLRFSNPSDSRHSLVVDAVTALLVEGAECYLTAQVLIELWVVATRPRNVNGLGWSVEQTSDAITQLLDRFPMADETSQIFRTWLDIVTDNQVKGKRTHDARIIAVMLASNISHILTLNPSDFSSISDIAVVHPQSVLDKSY
ncbi:MAG: PIN domain-containing protein [Phormidesmis sp.]